MVSEKDTTKIGRPLKYKSEYAIEVEKLCRLGATDNDLADFFQVNPDTINEWKKAYPDFYESLKRGKIVADMRVSDSLFKRAVGYQYIETTKEANKEGVLVITKEVYKEMPPETAASIFWLKNRRKEQWRDKHDYGFDLNNDIIVKRPTPEDS